MAYISPEERQRKKDTYDAYIYEVFITDGWDCVTYDRISKHFGITKSSVQRYYPHRADFGKALSGRVFPLMVKHLDFTSKQDFIDSWRKGMEDRLFCMVAKMLVENAMTTHTNDDAKGGMNRLMMFMQGTMSNEEALDAVERILGITVLCYMNQ
ncbi:TetR/AcrR family transcriptional regulator [Vibrio lentus]